MVCTYGGFVLLILFLLDYVSIMGLFVFISHYFATGLKQMQQKKVTGKS